MEKIVTEDMEKIFKICKNAPSNSYEAVQRASCGAYKM